jgi:hypothetical protein
MPWYPSLTLRFRNASAANSDVAVGNAGRAVIIPALGTSATLMFTGGTFDSNYNNRSAYLFPTPVASRTVIYALITGHGSDENGCGEFCVTSHIFIINGNTVNITFWGAGTEYGCTNSVIYGSEPNEQCVVQTFLPLLVLTSTRTAHAGVSHVHSNLVLY